VLTTASLNATEPRQLNDRSYASPERALWNAVIEQFVDDLKRVKESVEYLEKKKPKQGQQLSLFEDYRSGSRKYYDLMTMRQYVHSETFKEVCELAGHDVQYLRKGLDKLFPMLRN